MSKHPDKIASGIDELVARLRSEGIEEAERQSLEIIAKAKADASKILDEAEKKTQDMLIAARETIAREHQAANDSLHIAYRDLVLEIKNHLLSRFTEDVERLVADSLESESVIRDLVLAASQRILISSDIKAGEKLNISLPENVLELEDIVKDPDSAAKGLLADFVFAQQHKILKGGVSFSRGDAGQRGIFIQLVDRKIAIDLTDKAIADLLLHYLSPRFRALLDGIIH